MAYKLLDLVRSDHILVNMAAADAFSAIHGLNEVLVRTGHTLPEFGVDACEREKTFPTGLPTLPVAIAIPHADPDHVSASAVGIASLQSPVSFAQMGTDGTTVLAVHALFLLAIKEREKQVEMIQQLMSVIQDQTLLAGITSAASPAEVLDLIRGTVES